MTPARSITQQVQAELALRIGGIDAAATKRPSGTLAVEIDQIRQIADCHGLYSAVAVSHALESALAHGERGTLIQGLLSLLHDAIGCDRQDRAACETFAAACTVRLSA